MATRKIFDDENSHMHVYVNADNRLYIEVALREDPENSGFITLTINDAEELIQEVSMYLDQMRADEKN